MVLTTHSEAWISKSSIPVWTTTIMEKPTTFSCMCVGGKWFIVRVVRATWFSGYGLVLIARVPSDNIETWLNSDGVAKSVLSYRLPKTWARPRVYMYVALSPGPFQLFFICRKETREGLVSKVVWQMLVKWCYTGFTAKHWFQTCLPSWPIKSYNMIKRNSYKASKGSYYPYS